MADNDDVTCQLTRDDCIRIHKYINFLENKVGVEKDNDAIMIGLKAKNSIDKIVDGIYR